MFDRIAPYYDAMNSVMTAGLDARWRRRTIAALRLGAGDLVLDVATGTGKLALEAATHVAPGGRVCALDFAAEMLSRARGAELRSSGQTSRVPVEWREGDAMQLPFSDGSFDAVSIGFGLRNLPDVSAGLREMARVLRPGGRLAVLEIAEPRAGLARLLFVTWFRRLVPVLGRVIRRRSAYAYLPASLERYPAPEAIARRMAEAGLCDVHWTWLPSGFATLHVAVRGTAE
jgi:demethylmenaquinone methyltransferase/2-methoxy-6-polyprenyl-1,4-benzoquinol methylase